jgi:alkylation response protein AidB-like acyl-CoA dehydrogenase
MDFKLTEDQLMMRRMVREFAHKKVKPLSRELDRKIDPKECFSWELVKEASQLGLRTLTLPAEYGGTGADQLTVAIALEELGAADLGFASMFGQHLKYADTLVNLCSKEQKDEFVPEFVKDDTYFLASCITEPNAGTDNQLPYDAPGAAMQTFAERKGDEYIINGTKHFISNGGIAKLYFVYARTNRELGITESMSIFLVPHDTPGFKVARYHDKLGRRLLMNTELVFEDARVPACYLVGREGEAWQMFHGQTPGINNTIACLIGGIRACYEEALEYAKTRVQGGKPIIEHPAVGVKLADMRVKIEASRALLWKNIWNWESHSDEYDPKMNYLTKAFVNEVALDVVNKTVDILGGMGTDKEMPIEKYLRDIYTILHAYGNPSMNLIKGMPTA